MIYLIITTSINNRYGQKNDNERKQRYLFAISETLKQLPSEIKPIIVENNGERQTYLDNFYYGIDRVKVPVIYTQNNNLNFKSKGVNEILDLKEVIAKCNIQNEDMIIKLTGRYRICKPTIFNEVIHLNNSDVFTKCEAFIKFFCVNKLQFGKYECVLGCYAIRAKYLKLFNHFMIENYDSAEIAFAKYCRISITHLKEMEKLDVECCFAEDGRILNV